MARLIFITYQRRRFSDVTEAGFEWEDATESVIEDFPQICWENGASWAEANLWASHMADRWKLLPTIISAMTGLLTYANWLESTKLTWWYFPDRESDRCLFAFHGELKKMRKAKQLAPSTVTQRMNAVLRFYKWVKDMGLISESISTLRPSVVGVLVQDRFGFYDTMKPDVTSDLTIKNRRIAGAIQLEDGVLPVSVSEMQNILQWLRKRASRELFLIISIGFWTGLRLGSILDLKTKTAENAIFDSTTGAYRLAVGPSAEPTVATKFGMSGHVLIPTALLHEIQEYASCTRRLLRQRHSKECSDNLFLTRFGHHYNKKKATGIQVEMHRLKKLAEKEGFIAFLGFYIHRTRATFATELMRVALKYMQISDAVSFVRKALLHSDERTTLNYVNFIRTQEQMLHVFDEFTDSFMGLRG